MASDQEAPKKKEIGQFLPAFREAWSESSKEKKLFSKLKIFWQTFWKEWKGVTAEEEKASAESKKAVEKSFGETMGNARAAVSLDEGKVDEEGKKIFDEFLGAGVGGLKDAGEDKEALARDALKSLEKVMKNETVGSLSIEKSAALFGVGLSAIYKLKKLYSPEDFKRALIKFNETSEHSRFPFKKLVSGFFKIFSVKNDEDGLKLLQMFGIEETAGDLIGNGEASKAGDLLLKLGEKNALDNEDDLKEVCAFLKKYFFKKTSDVEGSAKLLNKFLTDGRNINVFAELMLKLDDDDIEHLSDALLGK